MVNVKQGVFYRKKGVDLMFKKVNSFAVLGAGNGGQAMAAYLALQGYEVNLYNRSELRIKAVKKAGGINLNGVFSGFGKLAKVTNDIKEAIENVEIIMVVTPAVAHKYLARITSPYLKDGQIIVLNPGRTGGALEFKNTLESNNCLADIIISEAQTFLYASRVIGPAQARIFGVKNKVALAAFPSIKTRQVIDKLVPVFPQFYPVENVLKTSLDNIGAIFHPAPTLLNMAWIETTEGSFNYYQDGISPSIARVLERLDDERLEVAEALGVESCSAKDWLRMSYGAKGRNLYELLQNNEQYHGLSAPADLKTRYIFEDVPMSLVPIASIGEMLSIETPTINMIIDMANIVHDLDYRQIGRSAISLGLEGLTVTNILNLVNKGYIVNKRVLNDEDRPLFARLDGMIMENLNDTFAEEGGFET